MKSGYKTASGDPSGGNAKRPSYFDGGNMKSDEAILNAYAEYFVKFVKAYKEESINVELVAPQNEPNYDQNYPSCIWDGTTFTKFVNKLGPAFTDAGLDTKVMLGTMSNSQKDPSVASAVMSDATAKGIVKVIGVQWGMLEKATTTVTQYGLPIWVSEHKCGNYPWNPSGYPTYNKTKAPNDQAYAVESWGELRRAIRDAKATAYNAWNMVLDELGLGNDTSRDWKQNTLLVVKDGKIIKTPTYYVFRHFSQFVDPGAKVVETTGGDAFGFKNPDGSLVAVMYAKTGKSSYTVSLGGKQVQFNMPNDGWATVKYKP